MPRPIVVPARDAKAPRAFFSEVFVCHVSVLGNRGAILIFQKIFVFFILAS